MPPMSERIMRMAAHAWQSMPWRQCMASEVWHIGAARPGISESSIGGHAAFNIATTRQASISLATSATRQSRRQHAA